MVDIGSRRLGAFLNLAIGLTAVLLIHAISNLFFFRMDLTQERRFSISAPTREMLSNLEDDVYVEVYLQGDLPSGFKRLQQSIQEVLEEFRIYSDNRLQYSFTDPDQALSARSREEFFQSVAQKGIQPTDVFLTENGQNIQKRILPGAVVSYGSREVGVMLLNGNKGAPSEVRLNQSVENVEYELAKVIRLMTKNEPEVIGVVRGHDEISGLPEEGLRSILDDQFFLRDVSLKEPGDEGLTGLDLMMINKPMRPFSQIEKYRLDQYILGGGNVILFLDGAEARVDTFNIALPLDLNLDDLLFRYGLRINKDLVQDVYSIPAPVIVGQLGDQPNVKLVPLPYYPMINTFSKHPIVRNLNSIKTTFLSSMDTVKSEGVIKTPLMFTSSYARLVNTPAEIDLEELRQPLDPAAFTQSNLMVGCLLEGEFLSLFRNRPLPEGVENTGFLERGKGKMVVIADGDIVKSDLSPQTRRPQPLGFDFYSGQTFANEDLVLNLINYLLEEDGLIQARNREIVLRPLDKARLRDGKGTWQLLNIVAPLAMIMVFGLLHTYFRRRKYAGFKI